MKRALKLDPAPSCPRCAVLLGGVSVFDGLPTEPGPGDISVCAYCTAILEFCAVPGGLVLIEVSPAERSAILTSRNPAYRPIQIIVAHGPMNPPADSIARPPMTTGSLRKYRGIGRCRARTRSGKRCSRQIYRDVDVDRLCTQHFNIAEKKREIRRLVQADAAAWRAAERLKHTRPKPDRSVPAEDLAALLDQARLQGIEEASRRAAKLAENQRLHKEAMARVAAEKAAGKLEEEQRRRLQWVARQRANRKG